MLGALAACLPAPPQARIAPARRPAPSSTGSLQAAQLAFLPLGRQQQLFLESSSSLPCPRHFRASALWALAALTGEVIGATTTEQDTRFHKLPSGLRLEVISQRGAGEGKDAKELPPLVFIHGSYHAAWCWAEHWLPFFAGRGYDCYALSLMGQGGSDLPDGPVAGTVQSLASDIGHFIKYNLGRPPVLIGHSFGGLVIQAYIAQVESEWKTSSPSQGDGSGPFFPRLAGAVLACSVPPSGNAGLVMRYIKTRPIASIKVTLSLAAKGFERWTWLCRETFFSPSMPDEDVERYQALIKGSSRVPLFDLRKLNASLPVARPPQHAPPVLVLGAAEDFIVDEEGLQETTAFFEASQVVVSGIAHDIMLDLAWEKAAIVVANWVEEIA